MKQKTCIRGVNEWVVSDLSENYKLTLLCTIPRYGRNNLLKSEIHKVWRRSFRFQRTEKEKAFE